MNITLTPELEQIVQSKVQTGGYHSANDVMREALRLLEQRDLAREEIREKIEVAWESLRQGKGTEGETFMAQMEAELEEEIRLEEQQAKRLYRNVEETPFNSAQARARSVL